MRTHGAVRAAEVQRLRAFAGLWVGEEQDGLYSDDGITLAQALEMLPGIDELDLEAQGAVAAA